MESGKPEKERMNMGMFLNSIVPSEAYAEMVSDTYFVDKSELLNELFPAIGKKNRYFCITRPRRFGKSVMADMVGAFFGKGTDGRLLFNRLAIAESEDYKTHLNQHNVIFIDFSRVPENCNSYQSYISRISEGIKEDIFQTYSQQDLSRDQSLWDIFTDVFQKTKEKFVFVIDEWDAIFHMPFIQEEQRKEYLLFLKNLLKDQVYVELAYMTGVLPIAKYSGGSELNMFVEYDMTVMERFSGYFGFSEHEVDELFEIYFKMTKTPGITRENLREWYDGYCTASGEKMYNPRSIICALTNNQLANYWTSSGPYDEIYRKSSRCGNQLQQENEGAFLQG